MFNTKFLLCLASTIAMISSVGAVFDSSYNAGYKVYGINIDGTEGRDTPPGTNERDVINRLGGVLHTISGGAGNNAIAGDVRIVDVFFKGGGGGR